MATLFSILNQTADICAPLLPQVHWGGGGGGGEMTNHSAKKKKKKGNYRIGDHNVPH